MTKQISVQGIKHYALELTTDRTIVFILASFILSSVLLGDGQVALSSNDLRPPSHSANQWLQVWYGKLICKDRTEYWRALAKRHFEAI